MMPLALLATNAVDVGQCRAVSYTSSNGVVPQKYARFGLVGCSHKEYRHESLIRPLAYILRIRRDFEFGEKWTKWWDV